MISPKGPMQRWDSPVTSPPTLHVWIFDHTLLLIIKTVEKR